MKYRRPVVKHVGGIVVAGVLALLSATSSFAADKVTVFAAASLKNAVDAVSDSWKADTQKETTISYAASSSLAKQIQEGAPADVFISADNGLDEHAQRGQADRRLARW